jgi:hypothetical protein
MRGNMKKILIFLTVTFFIILPGMGQDFFFIGESSYPCTETFTLQSNLDSYDDSQNLKVTIAKDGATGLIIVSRKTMSGVLITDKLIIYLDDGSVISCIDRGNNEQVDHIASSVYSLTEEEIGKMKNSNINTIKYTLKNENDSYINLLGGGNFSASNEGDTRTDFPAVITEFFSEE